MKLTEKQKSEGWCIAKFWGIAQKTKASPKGHLGKGIEGLSYWRIFVIPIEKVNQLFESLKELGYITK